MPQSTRYYERTLNDLKAAAQRALCEGTAGGKQRAIKLAEAIRKRDKAFAEGIIKRARSNKPPVFEQLARFIHAKMIANPKDPDGARIKDLNTLPATMGRGILEGGLPKILSDYSEALYDWAVLVQNGGKWDYKSHRFDQGKGTKLIIKVGTQKGTADKIIGWVYDPVSKILYRQDMWSNISYGFVGRALGFSETILLQGAGGAALKGALTPEASGSGAKLDETLSRMIETWAQGLKYAEPPGDLAATQLGMEIYKNFGRTVSSQNVMQSIRSAKSRLPTSNLGSPFNQRYTC